MATIDENLDRLVAWRFAGENRSFEIGGDRSFGDGVTHAWVVVEWLARTSRADINRHRCDEMIARYVSHGDTLSEALEQAVRDLPPEPDEES